MNPLGTINGTLRYLTSELKRVINPSPKTIVLRETSPREKLANYSNKIYKSIAVAGMIVIFTGYMLGFNALTHGGNMLGDGRVHSTATVLILGLLGYGVAMQVKNAIHFHQEIKKIKAKENITGETRTTFRIATPKEIVNELELISSRLQGRIRYIDAFEMKEISQN